MIKTKRGKYGLAAGVGLALAAGPVAYGAADIPLPPHPPALPPSPALQEPAQQVVIVERHGDDDGKDYVRTITRDGATFVFQTDHAMSDAEVQQ